MTAPVLRPVDILAIVLLLLLTTGGYVAAVWWAGWLS